MGGLLETIHVTSHELISLVFQEFSSCYDTTRLIFKTQLMIEHLSGKNLLIGTQCWNLKKEELIGYAVIVSCHGLLFKVMNSSRVDRHYQPKFIVNRLHG